MAIFNRVKPIPEHEAEGEIERVYHEIRQTLRVTGTPQMFRHWAAYGTFLPMVWEAFRSNAESRAFEAASDRLRAEAARSVAPLGKPNVPARVRLGESQTYHLCASLDLYYYLYPKLLALTSAVQLALGGERVGKEETGEIARIERGAPAGMIAMELSPEEPQDPRLRALFDEFKKHSNLPAASDDVRTLALWPDYLVEARKRLKPILAGAASPQAAERLRERARSEARALPYPVPLSWEKVKAIGQDVEAIAALTGRFEQACLRCILDIALLERDWRDTEALVSSPFPAPPRRQAAAAEEAR